MSKTQLIQSEYVAWSREAHTPENFFWNAPAAVRFCNFVQARTVLDVGCGSGSLAVELKRNGFEVTGCEADARAVEMAKTNHPDIRFVNATTYDDPRDLGLTGFDVVVSTEVIEHCFHPRQFLKFCKSAIRPGGHIIISTPYHGYLKNLAISLLNGWDKHFTSLEDGGHIKFFSPATITKLFKEEGLVVVDENRLGRAPLLWKGMMYLLRCV